MRVRSWKKPIGFVVAAIIIFFMVRNLALSLKKLGHYSLEISSTKLVLAFLVIGILFISYGLIWKSILGAFGNRISFKQSMRIWFFSQAAKYIPGKVWFALGRVYFCERCGIPRLVALFATGFETMLVVASAVVTYGLSSLLVPQISPTPRWVNLLLALAALGSVHPGVLRFVLKRITKDSFEFKITYFKSVLLLLIYLATWICYGVGFYLVSTAIVVSGAPVIFKLEGIVERVFGMIGINAAAWVVGFISFLTPAGLGVREGASGLLGSRILEHPYPNLVPLSARIWITICEAITISVVLRKK